SCETPQCGRNGCSNPALPEGGACYNTEGACHNGTCCKGCLGSDGLCKPTNTTSSCGLSTGNGGLVKCEDCTDSNPCTAEACTNGSCTRPALQDGMSCADADLCNGDEVCNNGQCQTGTPLKCNDDNPCTVDSCDPQKGCVNDPVEAGTSCD